MPRRCCVPGCKSNYDSTLKGCAPVSTFGFPKNPIRRELWLRAIPRKDWIPSSTSAVRVLHFEENDVIKTQKFKNINGVVENIPFAFPKLCDDAVPRIFENLPSYLTKEKHTPRREPDCRRRELLERHNEQVNTFLKNDDITGYDVFIKEFPQHLDTQCWNWKSKVNECVYFYVLNIDDSEIDELKVVCSVMVDKDLSIKVNLKGIDIPANDLNWALSPDMRLLKWSQFENLLVRYKNLSASCPSVDVSYYIKKAQENLENASNLADGVEYVGSKMLCIILDQIRLLNSKKRMYNPSTILVAFMMYFLSPTAYNYCREHLLLPHKRYLQALSSSLYVSPESGSANMQWQDKQIMCILIPFKEEDYMFHQNM